MRRMVCLKEKKMGEEKKRNMYFYLILIALTGMAGGGYFVYVSAIASIVFILIQGVRSWHENIVHIPWNLNALALAVLIAGYIITPLWGIDSGMAFMGSIKFIPVFLFFMIISQQSEEQERLIQLLPLLGTLMTVFSFVMMQFSSFESWVTVAGRLAGFFQYPNTYALFMLVCLIIVIYRIKIHSPDWLDILYGVVSLFGIYMSGSRAVLVLTAVVLCGMAFVNRNIRKVVASCLIVGAGVLLILAIAGPGKMLISRLAGTITNASTFWGRLLYAKDAVKMIVEHPFGMGYYGYFFSQSEYQTGVYSVVNAHNEFLQIMLDIGILPACLFYVALIKTAISKNTKMRDRVILCVLILHSLFDYDFQFLVMGFVLVLFLNADGIKEIRISKFTKMIGIVVGMAVVGISGMIGISDFFYTQNQPQKAVKYYGGNTMARVELLGSSTTVEEVERWAEDIIADNKHIAIAYSARAQVEMSKGQVENYLRDEETALKLAPYEYDEYVNYLETLSYFTGKYLENNDKQSAQMCVKRAENIPVMLKKVQDKTSKLGWMIKDIPQVTLSYENLELIKEMREKVDE